jgi:hypothetical protein
MGRRGFSTARAVPNYKIPDFEMTSLKVRKYTHSTVPSAGLVLTF